MNNIKPTVKLKTIQLEYKGSQPKILNNMMVISKNIYNCCIFTNNIFCLYKNIIFKHIYNDLNKIKNKYIEDYIDKINNYNEHYEYNDLINIKNMHNNYIKKINKYNISDTFYDLFNKYYNLYCANKELIKINNQLIFEYIKSKIIIENIVLTNSNIKNFTETIVNNMSTIKFNSENKFIVFDNLVYKIIKYYYDKIYITTKNELMNHKPLSYNNEELINNVKTGNYYYKDNSVNYKTLIMNEFNIKIISDQTIFKNITYNYTLGSNKKKLPADITLNIIDKYYEAIKSYYAKIELKIKANKPKYLDKNKKFSLFYYSSSYKIENNLARLTIGNYHSDNFNEYQNKKLCKINNRKYYNESFLIKKVPSNKKQYFIKVENGYVNKKKIIDANYIYFKLPNKLEKLKIKLIQIKSYGNKVIININYEEPIVINTNKEKISCQNSISIDPGVKNLMTIYNPTGTQHIIKGTKLKSINEFYNKKIAELQSINKKQYNKNSFNRLYSLLNERKNKINAEINNIINVLSKKYNDKKYIIMGYNEKWKTKVNLGLKTNRMFYKIPYQKIIEKLKSRLEYEGKDLIIKEESYTSICDSLKLESLNKQEEYSGKRTKRGLFISGIGKAINADLNGAINIMRKVINIKEIVGLRLFNPTILRT